MKVTLTTLLIGASLGLSVPDQAARARQNHTPRTHAKPAKKRKRKAKQKTQRRNRR